ncbi:hypothetical protein BJ742DRAFT_735546 [Cladochytrium replicatum]|nr:hypothetical protein BJ742DRAFT_735546 [Cladochytrium replicatum]
MRRWSLQVHTPPLNRLSQQRPGPLLRPLLPNQRSSTQPKPKKTHLEAVRLVPTTKDRVASDGQYPAEYGMYSVPEGFEVADAPEDFEMTAQYRADVDAEGCLDTGMVMGTVLNVTGCTDSTRRRRCF